MVGARKTTAWCHCCWCFFTWMTITEGSSLRTLHWPSQSEQNGKQVADHRWPTVSPTIFPGWGLWVCLWTSLSQCNSLVKWGQIKPTKAMTSQVHGDFRKKQYLTRFCPVNWESVQGPSQEGLVLKKDTRKITPFFSFFSGWASLRKKPTHWRWLREGRNPGSYCKWMN